MTAPTDPPGVVIGVDPAAPRPPLGFRLNVPDDWVEFDLDPATSDAWVERFLDERTAVLPEAARHRSRARQVLQSQIAAQREAGVFLSAFLAGVGARPGEMIGASLVVGWQEFHGGVNLDGVELFVTSDDPAPGEDTSHRRVSRMWLRHGECVRVTSRQLAPVPLTSHRQEVFVIQHLIPVPTTAWMGSVTMSTPDLVGSEDFAGLADRVAQSLEFLGLDGEPLPSAPLPEGER